MKSFEFLRVRGLTAKTLSETPGAKDLLPPESSKRTAPGRARCGSSDPQRRPLSLGPSVLVYLWAIKTSANPCPRGSLPTKGGVKHPHRSTGSIQSGRDSTRTGKVIASAGACPPYQASPRSGNDLEARGRDTNSRGYLLRAAGEVRASLINCALSVVQLHGFATNFSNLSRNAHGIAHTRRWNVTDGRWARAVGMAATALEGTARKTRSRKCASPGNSEFSGNSAAFKVKLARQTILL